MEVQHASSVKARLNKHASASAAASASSSYAPAVASASAIKSKVSNASVTPSTKNGSTTKKKKSLLTRPRTLKELVEQPDIYRRQITGGVKDLAETIAMDDARIAVLAGMTKADLKIMILNRFPHVTGWSVASHLQYVCAAVELGFANTYTEHAQNVGQYPSSTNKRQTLLREATTAASLTQTAARKAWKEHRDTVVSILSPYVKSGKLVAPLPLTIPHVDVETRQLVTKQLRVQKYRFKSGGSILEAQVPQFTVKSNTWMDDARVISTTYPAQVVNFELNTTSRNADRLGMYSTSFVLYYESKLIAQPSEKAPRSGAPSERKETRIWVNQEQLLKDIEQHKNGTAKIM